MKSFVCSYRARGSQWTFDLQAESQDDAERRLMALKSNARVDGELVARLPTVVPVPLLSRIGRWVRGRQ